MLSIRKVSDSPLGSSPLGSDGPLGPSPLGSVGVLDPNLREHSHSESMTMMIIMMNISTRIKHAENVHIDVKFQRVVHFEFGGFDHVMNPYLVLSFALF